MALKETIGGLAAALLMAATASAEPAGRAMQTAAPTFSEAAASAIYEELLLGMSADNQAKMRRNLRIYIVNRSENLVEAVARALREELPPEQANAQIAKVRASYADRTAIDPAEVRRTPADPRGVTQRIGSMGFCFVGEENLLAGSWDANGSRAGRILFHELGHATFNVVLDRAARQTLLDYDTIAHPKDPDASEAFAEATEAWFRVHQSGLRQAQDDQATIDALAPEIKRLLTSVYGPAR